MCLRCSSSVVSSGELTAGPFALSAVDQAGEGKRFGEGTAGIICSLGGPTEDCVRMFVGMDRGSSGWRLSQESLLSQVDGLVITQDRWHLRKAIYVTAISTHSRQRRISEIDTVKR